jgi:hypothetical protein
MKVLMHALAASCEELRARTGNPPLHRKFIFWDLLPGRAIYFLDLPNAFFMLNKP